MEKIADLAFARLGQTQSYAHEVRRLLRARLRSRRSAPQFALRVQTELMKNVEQFHGRWSVGTLKIPEVTPRLGHRRQGMVIGQLEHHARTRVDVQCQKEWFDVGDVVDDVVRGCDIRDRRAQGDFRPESFDRFDVNPARCGVGPEHCQHLWLVVDADHVGRGRSQGECRDASSTAHVEYRRALDENFARPVVRGRRRYCVGDLEEYRRVDPRTLRGGIDDLLGQGPRLKCAAPLLGGRTHDSAPENASDEVPAHVQRSSGATPASACSTWFPQPLHVGFEHLSHLT